MGQAPLFRGGKYLGSVESDVLTDHCKHAQLKRIGSCEWGCCDKYRCKLCGREFMVEVPD